MKSIGILSTGLLVLTVVLVPAGSQEVTAQTVWHVPGDYSTIQAAINAASNGDEILVAPGTYAEYVSVYKDVHLRSSGGPEVTIIDGYGNYRTMMIIEGSSTQSPTVDGFTIRGGAAVSEGGGIYVNNASPTIQNNIIEDNAACSGAGIAVVGGSPRIEANIIRHNTQAGCSGGNGGGGILVRSSGFALIIGNIIEFNSIGSGPGGGISLNAAGSPRIENNIIRFNTASSNGGGIYLRNASNATIIQNLVYSNSASKGGGVDWLVQSSQPGPKLLNNTIAENNAGVGSSIHADGYDDQVTLENNLLIGKSGQSAVHCTTYYGDLPPVFQYSNIYSQGASAFSGSCGDPTGSNGNISVDPLFVSVPAQDYHLLYGSPSMDSGDNNSSQLPSSDLEGRARILDGDDDGNAVVDMGVYEAAPAPQGSVVIGEVGQITDTLTHIPQTVVFSRDYESPVVFAQPLSYDGGEESLVRIIDVQSDRFTLFVDEAPDKDGSHTTETVSYLVLEAGEWTLADGSLLEVGSRTTSAVVGRYFNNSWETVTFASGFASTPVVLTQVQSFNDPGWVGSRQTGDGAGSVNFALEAEEAARVLHAPEVVGWLAIEPGIGVWNGHAYEAGHTPNGVTHKWYTTKFDQSFPAAPNLLASLASYDGGESSHLRYKNLNSGSVQVLVEEDKTNDKEKNHTTEVVDYLAIAGDGLLIAQGGVIQPTPIATHTPYTPKPSAEPPATNTPQPTGTSTWTPTSTITPTQAVTIPPTIMIPTDTITPTPVDTVTPSPFPSDSCESIAITQHYLSATSYIYLIVRNDNPVPVYLTGSFIDWPAHEGMFLDWLYFGGYYYSGDDYTPSNTSVVQPPRVLAASSSGYWYAGFGVRPENWKEGHWTIELTFDGGCVVPYEFWHFEPTPGVPTPTWTPVTTPTITPTSWGFN